MPLIPRSEMEAYLKEGRSVLIPGYGLVDGPEKLPTEAALAARTGDEQQRQDVQQQLLRQMEDLRAQLALLQPPTTPESPDPPPTEPEPGNLASAPTEDPLPAPADPAPDPDRPPEPSRFRRRP
jgi:hypothetical protein